MKRIRTLPGGRGLRARADTRIPLVLRVLLTLLQIKDIALHAEIIRLSADGVLLDDLVPAVPDNISLIRGSLRVSAVLCGGILVGRVLVFAGLVFVGLIFAASRAFCSRRALHRERSGVVLPQKDLCRESLSTSAHSFGVQLIFARDVVIFCLRRVFLELETAQDR